MPIKPTFNIDNVPAELLNCEPTFLRKELIIDSAKGTVRQFSAAQRRFNADADLSARFYAAVVKNEDVPIKERLTAAKEIADHSVPKAVAATPGMQNYLILTPEVMRTMMSVAMELKNPPIDITAITNPELIPENVEEFDSDL